MIVAKVVVDYVIFILVIISISYHFESKVRYRCPIPTTSILKMIRNFRLIEIKYSTDETFDQMRSTRFDDVIYRYFSFWRWFFNIWNTWKKSNTKKTWTNHDYVNRLYVNRLYVNRLYVNRAEWDESETNEAISSNHRK